METGIAIGLIVGLLGAGAGLFFALYALGFFQYLGGKKTDPRATDKQTLQQAILKLNNPAKPYRIVPSEISDLMAEWKIVDATWYGVFNKSRLKKAYRALLLLDEARHSVRCFETFGTISWTAGANGLTPTVRYSKSSFSGRILFQKSYGVGYGIKDPKSLEAGKVYEYRFDIDEIRAPIIDTVKASGWEWVPVTAKRHAVYKSQPSSLSPGTADSCPHCGAPRRPGAKFCPACGRSVTASERADILPDARTHRRWLPWVLVSTGLILMLFTVLVVIQWDKRSAQSNNFSDRSKDMPPLVQQSTPPQSQIKLENKDQETTDKENKMNKMESVKRKVLQKHGTIAGGKPLVETDRNIYTGGEEIRVFFYNAPGYSRDWICIVPAGSLDTEVGNYRYIPRKGRGVLTFKSPRPGRYEARAYYNYSPGRYVVSARYGFTVQDRQAH